MQKLEIFGDDYISQFIAKKVKENNQNELFQIYIAESLRLKGENKYISVKYSDLINGRYQEQQNLKSKDVIENIKKKFR